MQCTKGASLLADSQYREYALSNNSQPAHFKVSVDEINALELTAKQSAAQICLLMKFSLAWTWLGVS